MSNSSKASLPKDTSLRHRLAAGMERFANRHQDLYLIIAALAVLAGYAYLALFPIFAIGTFQAGVQLAQAPAGSGTWPMVAGYALVSAVLLFISLRIARMDYPEVKGLPIERRYAPELFSVIEETQQYYKYPSFSDIVLSDRHEMQIRETPILGLPFWTHKSLIIGLPYLQLLSPKHFRCELARLLARQTRHGSRTTSQMYRAHNIWLQYHEAFDRRHRLGDFPLRWFAKFYTPLLGLVVLPALRLNELAADNAAQAHINEQDLLETIKQQFINELFIKTQYWPKIRKMALHNPHQALEPSSKLEGVAQAALAKIDRRQWLEMGYAYLHSPEDLKPDLRQRLDNLGQRNLDEPPLVKASAAGLYLRHNKAELCRSIDALWRSSTVPKWINDRKDRRHNVEAIVQLSKKSYRQRLGFKEMLEYAHLAKALQGDSYYRSFRKLIKRNVKQPGQRQAAAREQEEARLRNVF